MYLRLVKVLILFTLCLSFEGCNDEVTPLTNIFQIYVDPSFVTSSSDDLLMIHDEAGRVVQYRAFEANDTITFSTPKEVSPTLTITFFRRSVEGLNTYYNLTSYAEVNRGEIWILKNVTNHYSSNTATVTGSLMLTLKAHQGLLI